jgi:hypothetical protein
MGNARISQQTLKIILVDRRQISQGHSYRRDQGQKRRPLQSGNSLIDIGVMASGEQWIEKPDKKDKACSLGTHTEKGSNGGWRPFVDIRTPEVEGK